MLCPSIIPCFPLTRVLADLNGVLGNYATLGLNIADFARYANKPSAQNVQAIVIPVIFSKFPCAHLTSILLIF
jgi:cytosine/uracil/thiamine/allantoin permease